MRIYYVKQHCFFKLCNVKQVFKAKYFVLVNAYQSRTNKHEYTKFSEIKNKILTSQFFSSFYSKLFQKLLDRHSLK